MPLSEVDRFVVPADTLDTTIAWLAEAGRDGYEAFVLWSGRQTEDRFEVTRVLKPRQTPHKTDAGLLVHVAGEALAEVNTYCYEHGEIIAAQLHTHPTDAYHSDTDDNYPLVTLLGSLSVVIPDFAAAGTHEIDRWAWYRLTGPRQWVETDRTILEVAT